MEKRDLLKVILGFVILFIMIIIGLPLLFLGYIGMLKPIAIVFFGLCIFGMWYCWKK